ncbi:hypothetical protein [Streptomyces youssoufiensis]
MTTDSTTAAHYAQALQDTAAGDRYVVCDGHSLHCPHPVTDGQVLPGLPA